VGVLSLAGIGFLLIRPLLAPREPAGVPLEISRVPSLPSTSALPPPIVEVGDVQTPLAMPVLLEVKGQSLPVKPSAPGGDPWVAVSAYSEGLTWIHGTVVNYVFGLDPASEVGEVVEGLQQGDLVTLHLSSGTLLTFRVGGREEVEPRDPALLAQSRPGLTLVSVGPEVWSAVTAEFEAAEEPATAGGGTAAEVGQPVQVGDVRIVVLEGHAEREGAGLTPGTMIYFVEFSLTNTGSSPLDPTAFRMELEDGLGNRYAPSLGAAGAGRYGPLSQPIRSGEEVSGTAAYIVPTSLPGPTLIWTFSPAPATELQARFSIPYAPPPATTALAQVQVLEAFLGEDGATLHVVAEVHNSGEVPLTVGVEDVALSSSVGPGELQVAAPPLPWTIEPGATRQVELQFARPGASTAIVTILGYTFEISGMP